MDKLTESVEQKMEGNQNSIFISPSSPHCTKKRMASAGLLLRSWKMSIGHRGFPDLPFPGCDEDQ